MEGLAHYQQQDYQAALACFEDAYRAQPLPALLYNIAQCQIRLNRRADAVRTLERMLAQPGMQAHPQAQQLLNELRQQGAGAATSGGS